MTDTLSGIELPGGKWLEAALVGGEGNIWRLRVDVINGGGGGGGGGGDASAANQALQIVQETAINTTLGAKADAASAATDTTAVSAISIWKQISKSLQAIASSLGVATGATFTSRSISSTAAAASTSLMVANSSRQSMKVQAPLGADLWINELGGTAGISLVDCTYIPAGVLYEPKIVSRSAITYYCATGSLVINASEA